MVLQMLPALFAIVLALSASAADRANPVFGGSDIRLQGYVAERMSACLRNHVCATDPLALSAVFHAKGETYFWQSEFWGKYMHAAVPFADYLDDDALRARLARSVADLISTQEADGYIGNYAPGSRYLLHNWDVWGTKYTLLGLLHQYDATKDAAALQAAERLCGRLMAEFGPGKKSLRRTGAFLGMPSCSVLEPVVWLYKRTQRPEYLAFAEYIRGELDAEDGARLIRDAAIPVFKRVTDGQGWLKSSLKAYEMMSCYQGLLELHDMTGDAALLQAALSTARSIAETEVNIVGGAASGEHWYDGAARETEVYNRPNETCVVTTWMRLCAKLHEKTGDAFWIDQLERTFYNIYLATLNRDGSEFSQYCPIAGTRARGEDHCKMHTNCCNANGPRGFLAYLRTFLVGRGDTLELNHYAAGDIAAVVPARGRKARFHVYTLYPETDKVEIRCLNDEPVDFALRLRIPGWCAQVGVRMPNGEVRTEGNPGGRAKYLDVRRVWAAGDTLELAFEMPAVAHFKNDHVAFTRGPVVLARDLRFADGDIGEVLRPEFSASGSLQAEKTDAHGLTVRFDRVRAGNGFWMAFAATLPTGCHSESTRDWLPESVGFCDFASAGNTWDRTSAYRVWLPMLKFETHR